VRKTAWRESTLVGKYSEILTDHVVTPQNGGVMDKPVLTGHAGSPGRGAFMILFLRCRDERITGPSATQSVAGRRSPRGILLMELIVGRKVTECRELAGAHLIAALEGVPPDKLHCPALAIGALQDALSKWPTEGESAQ